VWPLTARAQQPASKLPTIGFLGLGPASAFARRVAALREGLRDLGYSEGKNIVIEFGWADSVDQLPAFAAELVRMNVDVIFANSSTLVEQAVKVQQRGIWPSIEQIVDRCRACIIGTQWLGCQQSDEGQERGLSASSHRTKQGEPWCDRELIKDPAVEDPQCRRRALGRCERREVDFDQTQTQHEIKDASADLGWW
jgi:hypothetical protein